MIRDLIIKNRSYRRFNEEVQIGYKELESFIDLARLSASARNIQPLKYFISNDKPVNDLIFPYLTWAGYLKDWNGPKKGERPTAYIVICLDKSIADNPLSDPGIASQSILLGAVEKNYGGCIIAAFDKIKLSKTLSLSQNIEPLHVIALGSPIETIMLEDIENDSYKYWRDDKQVHHVPKRKLEEIIIS